MNQMELFNSVYNFFKINGYLNLNHIIEFNNEIDKVDLFNIYEEIKENKDLVEFLDSFQSQYCKAVDDNVSLYESEKFKLGNIGIGECIICYDENIVGYKTLCNHFMCIKCYSRLFDNHIDYFKNCPYCRTNMIFDKRMNEVIYNVNREGRDESDDELTDTEEFDYNEFLQRRQDGDDTDEDDTDEDEDDTDEDDDFDVVLSRLQEQIRQRQANIDLID